MRVKTILGIMLAFALLLQGCGRKGPLTLPSPDAQQTVTPHAPQDK